MAKARISRSVNLMAAIQESSPNELINFDELFRNKESHHHRFHQLAEHLDLLDESAEQNKMFESKIAAVDTHVELHHEIKWTSEQKIFLEGMQSEGELSAVEKVEVALEELSSNCKAFSKEDTQWVRQQVSSHLNTELKKLDQFCHEQEDALKQFEALLDKTVEADRELEIKKEQFQKKFTRETKQISEIIQFSRYKDLAKIPAPLRSEFLKWVTTDLTDYFRAPVLYKLIEEVLFKLNNHYEGELTLLKQEEKTRTAAIDSIASNFLKAEQKKFYEMEKNPVSSRETAELPQILRGKPLLRLRAFIEKLHAEWNTAPKKLNGLPDKEVQKLEKEGQVTLENRLGIRGCRRRVLTKQSEKIRELEKVYEKNYAVIQSYLNTINNDYSRRLDNARTALEKLIFQAVKEYFQQNATRWTEQLKQFNQLIAKVKNINIAQRIEANRKKLRTRASRISISVEPEHTVSDSVFAQETRLSVNMDTKHSLKETLLVNVRPAEPASQQKVNYWKRLRNRFGIAGLLFGGVGLLGLCILTFPASVIVVVTCGVSALITGGGSYASHREYKRLKAATPLIEVDTIDVDVPSSSVATSSTASSSVPRIAKGLGLEINAKAARASEKAPRSKRPAAPPRSRASSVDSSYDTGFVPGSVTEPTDYRRLSSPQNKRR